MSAKEFRFPGNGNDASAIPAPTPNTEHVHFYRRNGDNDYFYDIELWEDKSTTAFFVRVSHGKPGKFLWRNKVKSFDGASVCESEAGARKEIRKLIRGRATIKPTPFIRCDSSCRLALPAVAGGGGGGGGSSKGIPTSIGGSNSDEEPKAKKQKREHTSDGSNGAGAGAGGEGGCAGGNVSSASVLKMSASQLHGTFPFTTDLVFDYNIIFADPDHKKVTTPCEKAGRNVFGHSIIVGHNPKKNKPNFWCTGTKEGIIVPYNLKLKLGMTLKGRPNHQSTDAEKSRVAAMYRECELRGGGFKKPKKP